MGDISRKIIKRHPGYVAGRWYFPTEGTLSTGLAPGVNSIRLTPFMLFAPVTISDLAVKIGTTDAAGHVQAAIYNADPATFLPTTLAAATGSISTASATVFVGADITGADVPLVPGLYWSAVNTDSATATFIAFVSGVATPSHLVGTATIGNLYTGGGSGFLVHSFAQTFNTWPDLTGQTIVETLATTCAAVAFKAA